MSLSDYDRVPDAVQRLALLRRAGTQCEGAWAPAQQRIVEETLRCVRGTRTNYSAACRGARANRTSASSATVSIGVKSRCAMYSGRVGVRM